MSRHYDAVKERLACGWNTWDTRSVTSHVLLPEGVAIQLGFKDYASGQCLKHPLIGRMGKDDEEIHPGPHAYDGSYTELTLRWRGLEAVVQSATDGEDLLLLVTPLTNPFRPSALVVEAAMLWNRAGELTRRGDSLHAQCPGRAVTVHVSGPVIEDPWAEATGPYLVVSLAESVAVSTGRPRTVEEVRTTLEARKVDHLQASAAYGALAETHQAVQTCLAWDTIYEPVKDRVVSPVSRLWNCSWGGYVLFCWDNYFAGYMAALDHKDLAYANVIEITREHTEAGFVPNYASSVTKSHDRSQPPVGALMVREIYRRHREAWFLEEIFDDLLAWNRWWPEHRDVDGLLAWGSDPFEPQTGNYWELHGVNERFGAALESGLDNSPMYDDIPFDADRHVLELADAGLTALYAADCEALADIADVLERADEPAELRARAADYRDRLQERLWDEDFGLYCNRRTDTDALDHRISPTNFYPLLARTASPEQAQRMVDEHLLNEREFWGAWVLPSIARSDPAYPDNTYWRGRIWAPMNFLVYLGLRHYDLPDVRKRLAERSRALLMKEWTDRGHVHENYNADTGEGCDVGNSDRFYHWGGLLGVIALIEAGHLAPPEAPL